MKRRRILSAGMVAAVAFTMTGGISAQAMISSGPNGYYPGPDTEPMALVEGSGGVNCRGGDVCVEQVGDSAEVSWEIQTTPLASWGNLLYDAGGTIVAVPKVLEDLRLETIALPEAGVIDPETYTIVPSDTVREVAHPVELVSEDTDPLVEPTFTLFDDIAPAVTNDPEEWKAYVYDDAQAFDDKEDQYSQSGFPHIVAATTLPSQFLTDDFINDADMRALYDELIAASGVVGDSIFRSRYVFESYIPFWVEAWENGADETLSYSPALALATVFDGETRYPLWDIWDFDFRLVNLARAMTAVQAGHPEVIEANEPLLGQDYEFTDHRSADSPSWYWNDWAPLFGIESQYDALVADAEEFEAQSGADEFNQRADELYAAHDAYMTQKLRTAFSSMENSDLYNYIYIPSTYETPGVSSFKLTGTVTVESDVTYLPVRVWNTMKFCDGTACSSLGAFDWANPGALPDYSLTDAELNAEIAGLQTDTSKGVDTTETFRASTAATDGRLGSMQCAPTSEKYGVWNSLGTDEVQEPTRNPAQGFHDRIFYDLLRDASVGSFLHFSGYNVAEDGCDQADVLVTICDEPETPGGGESETPDKEKPAPTPTVKPVGNRVTASSQPGVVLADTGAHVAGIGVFAGLVILAGVAGIAVSRKKTTM